MHCDRAQEFFSDYLERTLDRPMTVALESHLGGCPGCREDVEGLRDTVFALESVPAAVPPPDGAWQVMGRVQRARAEQWEKERRQAPSFLQWLHSLKPANVAMVASLATLVIAGTALGPQIQDHIRNGFWAFGTPRPKPPVSAASNTEMSETPSVMVSYDKLTAAGQEVNLEVVPSVDLPDAHLQVVTGSLSLKYEPTSRINRGTRLMLPVTLPANSTAEVLRVTLTSSALHKEYNSLVVVPLGEPDQRRDRPVTLAFPDQPLAEALRQLAPFLGRPVVVDGGIEGVAQLQAEGRSSLGCLKDLAAQVGAEVSPDRGVYRLVPQQ
jgi:hypothetical protein